MESFSVAPIGVFRCPQWYRYQQPRQGVFAENLGRVELLPGLNFEQALQDLSGFSHLWLIYTFHLNETWRPLVNPPVNPDGKRKGLFATRSPHRPNRIGMSCVELRSISGLILEVANFDLLDNTPILDIKPYVPAVDSFPDATSGWLPGALDYWKIVETPQFEQESRWILEQTGFDLPEFCRVQLSLSPLDAARKRVRHLTENLWEIAFRTWRINFRVDDSAREIRAESVRSGYRDDELTGGDDRYGDMAVHRAFLLRP